MICSIVNRWCYSTWGPMAREYPHRVHWPLGRNCALRDSLANSTYEIRMWTTWPDIGSLSPMKKGARVRQSLNVGFHRSSGRTQEGNWLCSWAVDNHSSLQHFLKCSAIEDHPRPWKRSPCSWRWPTGICNALELLFWSLSQYMPRFHLNASPLPLFPGHVDKTEWDDLRLE